jgi:LysM repeat protein
LAKAGETAAAAAVEKTTYTVRRGDTLGTIATANHVTVNQIMVWNGLANNRIYPGDKLKLTAPDEAASQGDARPEAGPALVVDAPVIEKPSSRGGP